MAGQGGKSVPIATLVLLCYSVSQLATCGWWLLHQAGQTTCRVDDEGAWSIGVYKGTSPFSLQPLELHEAREYTSVAWPVANPVLTCASVGDSPSSFVADPFLWQHYDGLYMFYETKSTAKRRGEIGMARSTDGGVSFRHLGVVLSEPWHLSYPFVFGYKGQVYMLPEASASGQLRLYRAKAFPFEWELDRVLLDRPMVDASLVDFGGQWWMFASDLGRRGARKNGELEIWYADSPLGPWEQHAANPVMNGARHLGARSGGRPVVFEGKLYRFGQDCAETYGHKVVAYEVTKLSPTEFQQLPVELGLQQPGRLGSRKKAAWNSERQHHIDVQQLASGEWVAAMDGDRVPSGAISHKLLRTVVLAIGPWLALAVAWGGMHAAARYSPAARRLLFAASISPYAAPLLLPLKAMAVMEAQHKRDDSDDLEVQQQQHGGGSGSRSYLARFVGGGGSGGSYLGGLLGVSNSGGGYLGRLLGGSSSSGGSSYLGDFLGSSDNGGGSIKAEGTGLHQPLAPQWHGLLQRRPRAFIKAETLLSPRGGTQLRSGGLLHTRGWLAALAALPALVALGAGLGGALYLRPYFLPYRAVAVEGQYSQFTLVSMSYEARMPTLRHMVRHYSRCPSVGEIVLVWNKGKPPVPEVDFDSAVPVRVRVEEVNSLNNRFKIDPLIRTRAVLSLDDDIMMPCADIERGFAAWRQQPEKMVGYFPRLIEGSPLVFRGESYSIERGVYNAVLTGAAFIDSWTAFPAYWADPVGPAREAVDQVFNGEDLLMNFVLANRTHHLLRAGATVSMRRRQQELYMPQEEPQLEGLQGGGIRRGEAGEHLDSAVQFLAPTRRLDISKLSGVGISHNFERFKKQAAHYLANFTSTFGYMPLEPLPHNWEHSRPPFCAIGWLGCTYLN